MSHKENNMRRISFRWFLAFAVLFTAAVQAEQVALPYKGLTLQGELRLASGKGIGEGPLVLMTHGTLAHGRMEIMQGFQDLLGQKNISSLAINLSLGLDKREGMFDCATLQRHKHTDAMDEIGAWLAWAKQKGAKNVVLLGHSRGGNQTAWFAAEQPDPTISKVILVAPMTWSKETVSADYKQSNGAELGPIYAHAEKLVGSRNSDQLLKSVGFLHCQKANVTAAAFVDYYRNESRFDTPNLLGKISQPVLVIVGSDDSVVKNLASEVEPLADGKRITLQIVDGADHFFRDLYAEEAVDAMVPFINK
jgi:pimeloyl-ACP methyl ester carboxylesterase